MVKRRFIEMKKALLVLTLAGSNVVIGSEVFIASEYVAYPSSLTMRFIDKNILLTGFNDYVVATKVVLPDTIRKMNFFEDLSEDALRRKGGWGWYLSELFVEGPNRKRLQGNNKQRVKKRRELNNLLRPIYGALESGDFENVVVVEYLLNTLINANTYSYAKMREMNFEDKKAILVDTMNRYINVLNSLEQPAKS